MAENKLLQAGDGQQPDDNGGSTRATTSTTTNTSSGNPYEQFRGSSLDDVYGFIQDRINEYKPESEADRKLREKREKRDMFLANIADVLGSMHKSYSYQRGVKPMDLADVSAKTRERIDKAKAERQKDNDRMLNYAVTLGNLKDKDRDFNFRVTQAEQSQNNWREQFDASRKDRADDVAFRDKKFDTDNEHWQNQFDEGKRQFDVTSAEQARHNKASEGLQGASLAEQRRHNKAAEGLEGRRLALSEDGNYTEFYIPSGGLIKVKNSALNSHNLSYVYNQILVDEVKTDKDKKTYKTGKKVHLPSTTIDKNGNEIPVSADQMLQQIGQNVNDPNVQSALRAIGGVTTTEDNTPPSRRNNNSNTPPSRR